MEFSVGTDTRLSEEPTRAVVLQALRDALARRPIRSGLTHHSDRGSQYASHDYRAVLGAAGIVCSMSRRGNVGTTALGSRRHSIERKFMLNLKPAY